MGIGTRNRLITCFVALATVGVACAGPSSVVASPRPDPPGTVRYFGAEATWNRPVSELGRSTRYADYAERFWKASDLAGVNEPSQRGSVDVLFGDYSVPIYDRGEATTTIRVFTAGWGWPGTLRAGSQIPWNPAWRPAGGNDAMMIIFDPATGVTIELWSVQVANWSNCITVANLVAGFVAGEDLCVGSANVILGDEGDPVDVRIERGVTPVRGMGIEKLALLTRAAEVASGRIDHALEMTVGNTMFGPVCPADAPGAGTSCGFSLAPATKVEHPDGPADVCSTLPDSSTPVDRSLTVPSGMRFALDMSDSEIERWLANQDLPEPLRSTARIFAVALRDYGWIIAETSCTGASIETDGLTNPETAQQWERLGIEAVEDGHRLLDGLFTSERIVVVNPPGDV